MKIYTVSEFISAVSDYLEQGLGTVCVQGEVSGYRVVHERLVYFTLKDKLSQVLCFCMVWDLSQALEDGMEIKVYGLPKLFKKRGEFYLSVQEIELVGEGALLKAYEALKKKLEKEGIFLEKYKKPLPRFPESIGIITAKEGAAFQDILQRLNERWRGLKIYFLPVQVQGLGAVNQINAALQYFNQEFPVEVLILTRGGGSLEDYQPFNTEKVVRAVFSSKIPIICGIGHEKDVSLAELAADMRASTPTNAAEIVIPHLREITWQINEMKNRILSFLEQNIFDRINNISNFIERINKVFEEKISLIYNLWQRFNFALQNFSNKLLFYEQERIRILILLKDKTEAWLLKFKTNLYHLTELLNTLSPKNTLKRGYSITIKNNKIIKEEKEVVKDDLIETKLYQGKFQSKVM